MKVTTFSIVGGTLACQAKCPFCIARMTPVNNMSTKLPPVNWRNFCKACRLAQVGGATTVLITSKGEPTLYPDQVTEFLEHLAPYNFPVIEMQTNGITIADGKLVTEEHLQKWYELGLTTIAISVVGYDPKKNHEIYLPYRKPKAGTVEQIQPPATTLPLPILQSGSCAAPHVVSESTVLPPATTLPLPILDDSPKSLGERLTALASTGEREGYIDLPKLVKLLRKPERRFTIRLTCIAADGYIDSAEEVKNLLAFASANEIEQVSLTPVTKPFDSADAEAFTWTQLHHLKDKQKAEIEKFLSENGQVVRVLPHGATVYDVGGQNLNYSNCLTRDTRPDEVRSLIFFPDGHLYTNWDLSGSVLF
jgi:pyruvate-formate lyase-activating enzyme